MAQNNRTVVYAKIIICNLHSAKISPHFNKPPRGGKFIALTPHCIEFIIFGRLFLFYQLVNWKTSMKTESMLSWNIKEGKFKLNVKLKVFIVENIFEALEQYCLSIIISFSQKLDFIFDWKEFLQNSLKKIKLPLR